MTGPPAESRWPVASRQWQGARPYQEDDFGTLEGRFSGDDGSPGVLIVLADGMGGEAGGAVASRTVVQTFLDRFPDSDGAACIRFQACLDEATDSLREQTGTDPALDGMGSTVVAAHYDGEELSWLSVGDSPMWLFSGSKLVRLNADHSMAPVLDRLARDGELSPEEARGDSRRNMLRSAVTGAKAELIDCAKRSCPLGTHDCLLVASDGIQTLAEEDIGQHLASANGDMELAADALFSAVRAAAAPGQDNVTFLLVSGEVGQEEPTGQSMDAACSRPDTTGWISLIRRSMAPLWPGLGLGVAIGLLLAALALWWLSEPSVPESGGIADKPPADAQAPTSDTAGSAGSLPGRRSPEPDRQSGSTPTKARSEEAGIPAPLSDTPLEPPTSPVPGTFNPNVQEAPAAGAGVRADDPTAAGEAPSMPATPAQPAAGASR